MSRDLHHSSAQHLVEMHKLARPRQPREQLVLRHLKQAFLNVGAAEDGPVAFSTLKQFFFDCRTERSKSAKLHQCLRRLRDFLAASPSIPPRSTRWLLKESRVGRRKFVLLTADDEQDGKIEIPGSLPSASLTLTFNKGRMTRGFDAYTGRDGKLAVVWTGLRIMHLAKGRDGIRFELPPHRKLWEFPREGDEYVLEREIFWRDYQEGLARENRRRVKARKLVVRHWNGRLWGVAASHRQYDAYVITVKRVFFKDHLFIAKHWQTALPGSLRRRFPHELGFSGLLTPKGADAHVACPAIALMRLGVLLYLPSDNLFALTRQGDNSGLGLAGRGVCYSVMTPEGRAQPKLNDQIARRLVEDIGLAIESDGRPAVFRPEKPVGHRWEVSPHGSVTHLAYAIDRCPTPAALFPEHWAFAVVEILKTEAEIREIFDCRRYGQFARAVEFMKPRVLMEACLIQDTRKFDRALLIAVGLYFECRSCADFS